MKRRLLLALVVLSLALTPAVATAAAGAPNHSLADAGAETEALATSQRMAANNSTATPTPTENDTAGSDSSSEIGEPSDAAAARILPVHLEADFVNVETHKQNQVYNTTGPFAFFSVSEKVEQVAIKQQGATATVLEGGHQVRVQYQPDAAPVGQQSLYSLTIWFEDGTTRTVDLYASKTSVSVGAAEMKKYRPLILEMLQDAQRAGYERSPDGVEKHYHDVQETAQLLDSLLTEQAKRLAGSIMGIAFNPLGIMLFLIAASLVALWQLRNNRSVLEIITNSTGKAEQLRERLWIEYKQQQQTAADEQLRELSGIGEMGEIYWSDAFGVDTTAGLAELFRTGIPVKRDGEVQHVGGVEALSAEDIEGSWLEAVCRDHRLPSAEIALSHGKKALRRMISEYGMAHHYEDAYQDVAELIDELDQSRDVSRHSASTWASSDGLGSGSAGGAAGGAAGGDD